MDVPVIIKNSVPKAYLKKKGDLATATDDGQLETLSVGSDGTVLTADSAQPTGFKWVTGNGSSASWGAISGTISNQSDLENALNGKEPANTNIQGHIAATGNPHETTRADVGLGNVTNEAQIAKSVATAKGSLISFSGPASPLEIPVGPDAKVLTADSTQPAGVAWKDAPVTTPVWGIITGNLGSQTDLQMALQNKSDISHTHTSSQVGLGNVTNNKQINAAIASVDGNLVSWSGTTGDTVVDSGKKASDFAAAAHTHTPSQAGLGNVTNDVQIPKSLVTAKGDLLIGTGSAAVAKQTVGSNGQILQADSSQPTGVKWAPAGSTSATWGGISGTLSAQTDLQTAMTGKAPKVDKYTDDYSDLASAVSALNSAGGNVILHVTSNQTISSNVTVNSNITLKIHRSAVISINDGYTLTINGTIESGPYQIFTPPAAPTINAVRDKNNSSPPASPGDGIRYIVKPSGAGIWLGHDNQPVEFNFSSIEGLSRTSQCVVSKKGHGKVNGESIYFTAITQTAWTGLNNHYYVITVIDSDTFSIPLDTSGYAAGYDPVSDGGVYGFWRFTPLASNMIACINNVSYKWNGSSWVAQGRVEFGHGVTPQAFIRWWGAVGDGVTNDTAAVQAAINAVCAYTPGTLQGCMGDVYLVDAVHIPSVSNNLGTCTLDGNGSTLQQNGLDNILNFGFRSNNRLVVKGWRFQGKSVNVWSKSPLGLGSAPTQVYFSGVAGTAVGSILAIISARQWYYDPTTDTLYIHNAPAAPALPTAITVDPGGVSVTDWTKWYGGTALNINDPAGVTTTVRDCVIFYFDKALQFGYGIDCQIENLNITGCNYAIYARRNGGQSRGVYFKAVNMSYIYSNDAAIYWEDAMGLELDHCCLQIYAGRAMHLIGVCNVLVDVLDTEGSCYGGIAPEDFLFDKCRNIDIRHSSLTLGSDFTTEMCSAMFNIINTSGGVSIKNNNISITDRTVPAAIYTTDLTTGYIDISENTINGSHANADGHPVADMRRNNYQTFSLVNLEDHFLEARNSKNLTNWATVNPTFASNFTPTYTGCTGSNPDNTTGYDDSFSWKIRWANATDNAYYPSCLTYPASGLWYGILTFRYKGDAPHLIGISLANYGAANYLAVAGDNKWRYGALIGNAPKNLADAGKPHGLQIFAKGGPYPATIWLDCISVRWFSTLSEACAWVGAFDSP